MVLVSLFLAPGWRFSSWHSNTSNNNKLSDPQDFHSVYFDISIGVSLTSPVRQWGQAANDRMNTRNKTQSQSPWLAILTNLLATVLLAALIGLGIYVNLNKLVVSNISSNGYKTVDLDTTTWNIGCTIVGTAVGLLAAVGFAMQDEYLTRRELARDRGVVALFLRPLTIKRGVEQVFRLQLPLERTLLVLLTIATALTSATVVALFGIRATVDEIINPAGSYPLATLNSTFFESDDTGGVYPAGSPVSSSQTSRLSGFIYKAAYIEGLKLRDMYRPNPYGPPYVPEQGSLGDTIYGELNTRGIGLNTSSYLQYSGMPDGFNMPGRYEFNKLQGSVFGTHVTVSCQNASSQYTESETEVTGLRDVHVKTISKPGGPNITAVSNLVGVSGFSSLVIASAVTVDRQTGEPVHTIVVPAFFDAFGPTLIYECAYSGREYLADVLLASAVSPIRIVRETDQGPLLGPHVQQLLANTTHMLVASGGAGGNLAQGFIDATFNADGLNSTADMRGALETVFAQVSEAYISLLRQTIERSNLYGGGDSEAEVRLYATVLRLGGGSHIAWVAVLGVLLVGAAAGTVRTCAGSGAVAFEAQDAVRLLREALDDPALGDRTRVGFEDGIVVLGRDGRRARGEGGARSAGGKAAGGTEVKAV